MESAYPSALRSSHWYVRVVLVQIRQRLRTAWRYSVPVDQKDGVEAVEVIAPVVGQSSASCSPVCGLTQL